MIKLIPCKTPAPYQTRTSKCKTLTLVHLLKTSPNSSLTMGNLLAKIILINSPIKWILLSRISLLCLHSIWTLLLNNSLNNHHNNLDHLVRTNLHSRHRTKYKSKTLWIWLQMTFQTCKHNIDKTQTQVLLTGTGASEELERTPTSTRIRELKRKFKGKSTIITLFAVSSTTLFFWLFSLCLEFKAKKTWKIAS